MTDGFVFDDKKLYFFAYVDVTYRLQSNRYIEM